jgi:hypothetical protein
MWSQLMSIHDYFQNVYLRTTDLEATEKESKQASK